MTQSKKAPCCNDEDVFPLDINVKSKQKVKHITLNK